MAKMGLVVNWPTEKELLEVVESGPQHSEEHQWTCPTNSWRWVHVSSCTSLWRRATSRCVRVPTPHASCGLVLDTVVFLPEEELCLVMCLVGVGNVIAASLQACSALRAAPERRGGKLTGPGLGRPGLRKQMESHTQTRPVWDWHMNPYIGVVVCFRVNVGHGVSGIESMFCVCSRFPVCKRFLTSAGSAWDERDPRGVA